MSWPYDGVNVCHSSKPENKIFNIFNVVKEFIVHINHANTGVLTIACGSSNAHLWVQKWIVEKLLFSGGGGVWAVHWLLRTACAPAERTYSQSGQCQKGGAVGASASCREERMSVHCSHFSFCIFISLFTALLAFLLNSAVVSSPVLTHLSTNQRSTKAQVIRAKTRAVGILEDGTGACLQ